MMFTVKKEQKTVPLDAYEEGAVIEGLNKIRTEQLERGESAEFVSDVMLKILQAPTKKVKAERPHSGLLVQATKARDEAR